MSVDGTGPPAPSGRLGSRYELHERIETATTSNAARLASWRAYDTTLRRQVRLDVHRPGGHAARRFLDTAFSAGAVTHPTLARVLDVVDEGELAYVVSAWVDGTALTTLLADGPLDPEQAATMFSALTAGVQAAHAAGTTVGVLRPDHLLLTHSGTVTLVRAPRPGPTPSDDVRGLGALLYAALTGHWPLDVGGAGLPPAPTSGGRLCTPAQLRAGIPSDLSLLTMRALYPDQPSGVPTAEAFAAALAQRAGPAPAPAGLAALRLPETRVGATRRSHRPRLTAARLAVPLAVLLVVGLGAWLLTGLLGGGDEHGRPAAAGSSPRSSSASSPPASGGSPSSGSTGPSGSTSAALRPVRPASVTSYNPLNKPPGDDNASEVGLAADGNATTSWETDPYQGYPDFGRLKSGSGILFDLGSATKVREVQISTPTPGVSLQVMATDSTGQPPDAMPVAGRAARTGSSVTVSTADAAAHRYWVVWLTSLPATPSGQFQGALSEVHFLR